MAGKAIDNVTGIVDWFAQWVNPNFRIPKFQDNTAKYNNPDYAQAATVGDWTVVAQNTAMMYQGGKALWQAGNGFLAAAESGGGGGGLGGISSGGAVALNPVLVASGEVAAATPAAAAGAAQAIAGAMGNWDPLFNVMDGWYSMFTSDAGAASGGRLKPGVGNKFHDVASKVGLRRESLNSGTTALKKAGLIRRSGQGGAYEFYDPKTGAVRAKWVPKTGKEPAHWSKFEPSGTGTHYLDNAGRPVTGTHKSHRIPSNGGGPIGGTSPGSRTPIR